MLSVAAFLEGKHAQAFPSFGSERTGAPVVSFCRIDDKEIRLREPILEPDALIVQDPTLFKAVDVFQGLRRDGYLLVNTNRSFDELHHRRHRRALPPGHARIGAGDRARRSSTSAGRCPTRRCSAPSRHSPGSSTSIGRSRDPRGVSRQAIGDANVAAARAAYDAVAVAPAAA